MQDKDRRPNFVFVYTDDQRWDALGVVQREQGAKARFPWFRTPNLDRVAAEGVRFRNAFVVSALCAPSRAAFLTGQYNHRNGVANNHTPFPERSVTHATLLKSAGYATAYVGKWHMGNQRERPGFDYAASFVGQGRYQDCPFVVNGKDTPTTGWVDDVTTDYAVEYLRQGSQSGRPFSLVVGYKSSHGPWQPPDRAKDRFASDVSRPVPNLDVNAVYRPDVRSSGEAANPERVAMHRNYFRTLSAVDDNVGRLLKELDALGLAENTVFVYTSDNGYYLGEHGLGDKRSAYDESVRIPLLVRWPKRLPRGGKVEDAMALNIDIAPTLLEAAGVPVPPAMQGRSLLPSREGSGGGRPREAFFYEYFYERGYPQIPTVFAVRTPDAKLVKYPGHDGWTELFDLKADPYETKNLYADPAKEPLRRRMLAAYDRAAKEAGFRIPEYADRPGAEGDVSAGPRNPARDREVLRFEAPLAPEEKDRIRDKSGLGNHGTIHGSVANAAGPPGNTPLIFDGAAYIEVPNSPSLNPAGGPWTVEVALTPEKPDGVILARGGQSLGYALYLDGAAVCFAVNTGLGSPVVVRGPQLPVGRSVRVRAVVTRDRRARLLVDDREAGVAPLPSFMGGDPRDPMQIGADLRTTVVPYRKPGRFTGRISSVRIFSGEEKK